MANDSVLAGRFDSERGRLTALATRILGDHDAAHDVVLADTVGVALHVVLDRLTPSERVAFVLHDSFGFEFDLIATMLDTSLAAPASIDALADWEVVDAFMAAARGGDVDRLLRLLAPEVTVTADVAAAAMGTPDRLQGATEVATFFNGGATAAFPVFVGERPGAAWIHRGEVKVVFDFTITSGRISELVFRAEDSLLAAVRRRDGAGERGE